MKVSGDSGVLTGINGGWRRGGREGGMDEIERVSTDEEREGFFFPPSLIGLLCRCDCVKGVPRGFQICVFACAWNLKTVLCPDIQRNLPVSSDLFWCLYDKPLILSEVSIHCNINTYILKVN